MKALVTAAAGVLLIVAASSAHDAPKRPVSVVPATPATPVRVKRAPVVRATAGRSHAIPVDALTEVVQASCAESCHSDNRKLGNLSLASFNVANSAMSAATAEKMIVKLRTGMMPPAGRERPGGDTLTQLAETMERLIDAKAAANPNPGNRTFQRLNRAEYERSVRDVLGLEVSAGSWLPLDTKSANFDNIADAQLPSAMMLDAYMDAASAISRLAVGDPKASVSTTTYKLARLASQTEQVDGAPQGTRGGESVTHTFPADGDYTFAVLLQVVPTGQLYGSGAPFEEKVEIAVDGERVALLDVDRWTSQADPNGTEMRSKPVQVRAGAHRVSATFLRTYEGPVNDNIAPIGHSIADTQIGAQSAITISPHLQHFAISGPFNPTGVSETATRKKIFSCRPTTPAEARPCAEQIVNRIGTAAYRRSLNAGDVKSLMTFYDTGSKLGGFELGIRTAIEAILASPHFIFRVESRPAALKAGQRYAVSSVDVASRLSFFLWGAPPDSTLLALARRDALNDTTVLRAQMKRMLADPRSEALSTRFAAQWLRLQDIEKVAPDALQFPNYHEQLATDMRRETELFFNNIVRENRSALELYSADYTFMNERLAEHYGVPGVTGSNFRKVKYIDDKRSGLLGQGSILTLTSHANRTSPVLRGKWVMEVFLGSPPPPPPPNVPDLDKTAEAKEGRMLTTRERMEMHRDNPSCRSCHRMMDPIGLALDNFDVTGQWRVRENGVPVDTRGDYFDGTKIGTLGELQRVMLKRPVPMLRSFTQNLMAYAVGRRMEYYDTPAIRRVVADAQSGNYKMQDLIWGVVKSDPFRMKKAQVASTDLKSQDAASSSR